MRKILIGLVSLGGVLAVYLLYTGASDSPVIETDSGDDFIAAIADSNIGDFDASTGNIGGVGVGPAELARYVKRNLETQEIERIWGFKKLLSKARGLWEVEKPYAQVFQRGLTCNITADWGQVQVETAADRTTPKDATFRGNVVVHVLPGESSELPESFVYLDDVVILSERSQLSTKGPVEYISDDIHMQGRGLELIFSSQSNRLEFFRIVHLERLRIKNYQAMFAEDEQPAEESDESTEVAAPTGTEQMDETIVAAVPEQTEESTAEAVAVAEPNDGVFYKCILSKNVLIDTPEELIFADQRICISDIFWSKGSTTSDANDANDTRAAAVAGEDAPAGDSNSVATVDAVAAADAVDPNVAVMAPAEPNALFEGPWDVEITCDNGLVLVPMDTTRDLDEYMHGPNEPDVAARGLPERVVNDTERTVFLTPRIDYNAVTEDVIADGLSQFTFYDSNSTASEANEPSVATTIVARDGVEFFRATNQAIFKDCLCTMPQDDLTEHRDATFLSPVMYVNLPADKSGQPEVLATGPVKLDFYMQDLNDPNAVQDANAPGTPAEPFLVTVTAQKHAKFSGATNPIVLEGDCRCETTRQDPNGVTKYELRSELMTVILSEQTDTRSSDLASDIEKFTASGGVVRLVSTTMARTDPNLAEHVGDVNEPEMLSGVEVKCSLVVYDPNQGSFKASGAPGEIWMDNSKAAVSERDPNGFSLSGPCYALLENFDSLKYYIDEDRIVAEAVPGGALWLHYVPVVDGVHDLDSITTASAQRVEAFLVEMPDGRTELSTLSATGGIDVNDLSNGNHFIGSDLYYDHTTSIMTVKGDDTRPCLCNGALVDDIEYNVSTGKLKADIVELGPIQTNQ